MPESPKPTKTLTTKADAQNRPRQGYVRSGVTHIGCEWTFEVVSEEPRVGVVTIETQDGKIEIGLNRRDAVHVQQKLQLFLEDLPEESLKS
jgi:hypothetical protein